MKTFDESFTGICLLFEPSEAFVPSGKPQSMLSYAKKRLAGAGVAVAFVVLTTLISSLIGVINPAFSRIFLDRLLTGENPEWVTPFIVALAALGVVQIVVAWIGEVYTLKINGKMDMIGSSTFMWKVLRLPMEFFSQRMAGDIQGRQASNFLYLGNACQHIRTAFLKHRYDGFLSCRNAPLQPYSDSYRAFECSNKSLSFPHNFQKENKHNPRSDA